VQCRSAAATEVTINDGPSSYSTYRNHLPPAHEVHVIGVYETMSRGFREHPTGTPQVHIEYDAAGPMKPITLVLSSYESNNWQLDIDPRANVERIVLNGYHSQSTTGAGDIPVLNFNFTDGRGATSWLGASIIAWPHSTGGSNTQQVLVAVEELLGTRISSFTGTYRATDFTVVGSPAGEQTVNPRLGAGNLHDTSSPDLIYNVLNGNVQLDLTDLAAQYPQGSGEIWWQHFYAQRLFFSLANHDGSFDVAQFDPTGLDGRDPAINENRLGYNWASLRDWHGEIVGLGRIFPTGMNDPAQLRSYLAAASFSTGGVHGEFDLVVVPEPATPALILFAALAFCRPLRRRR